MEYDYYPFGIPFIPLENYQLDTETVRMIPEEMARCHEVVALEKWDNIKTLKSLTVGMVNPEDKIARKILENHLQFKIHPIKVEKEILIESLNRHY
jgi:type IV pilus assembly protein PilB